MAENQYASKIKEIQRRKMELEETLKNAGKGFFSESAIGILFDEFEEIVAVRWRQYTPYFNDGDPCVFRVNEPELILSDPEFEGEWLTEDELDGPVRHALSDFAATLDEDLCRSAFNDHVEVTINRGSTIMVDDYDDHD